MHKLALIYKFLEQKGLPCTCHRTSITWSIGRDGEYQFEAKIDNYHSGIRGRADTIEEAIEKCLENAEASQHD